MVAVRVRRVFVCVLACFIALFVTVRSAHAEDPKEPNVTNKLHMFTKPAVVRLISGYAAEWVLEGKVFPVQSISSGSGFFVGPDGYIVTNAHNVSDIKDGDDEAKKHLLAQLAVQALQANRDAVTEQNVQALMQSLIKRGIALRSLKRVNWAFLQNGAKYTYEIKAYGAPSGEGKDLATGKDIAVLKVEIKNAPTLRIGDSSAVAVGDKIWVIGYPAAGDSDLLDEKSKFEPTTNEGAISAKKSSADGASILQTSANATHGNSGGPVVNAKGEVIGLLTFRGNTVNGQEVQGFNFIVTSNTAQEFVRQAGADTRESPIDAKWKEGLENYWKQEYSYAQQKFSEVRALFPDHAEAQKLITECQEKIAKGEDKSGNAAAGAFVAIMGVVGLVIVLFLAVVIWLFVRKKPAPAATASAYHAHSQHQGYGQNAPAGYGAPQPGMGYGAPAPAGYGAPGQAGYGAPPSPHVSPVAAAPTAYAPPQGGPARTEAFQAVPMAMLECTAGPVLGQSFPIGNGIHIGRDAGRAQIVVNDTQVSGQHAWVGFVEGRLLVRDLGSTNGTYLTSVHVPRVTESPLNNGDTLILGQAGRIVFRVKVL